MKETITNIKETEMISVAKREIISVRNVSKSFSEKVLDGVSFLLREGEKIVIFGHNGSGKTTLIRCIMGFLNFDGEIEVLGVSVKDKKFLKVREKIGYVPQILPIWDIKVSDLIKLAETNFPKEEIEKNLEIFEVSHLLKKNFLSLSGGTRQKIMLSIALSSPHLLILDEPFSNIDKSSLKKLKEILSSRKNFLISTHRLEDLNYSKIIFMEMGRIIDIKEIGK